MLKTQAAFSVDYQRSYGQHEFVTGNGTAVSAISAPSWETYYEKLAASPSLGNIALSPELITTSMDPEAVAAARYEIAVREVAIKKLSLEFPQTTFVLGTAAFDSPDGRPANSQRFIVDGQVVAQNNKRFSAQLFEKLIFSMRQNDNLPTSNLSNVAGAVCSDILGLTTTGSYAENILNEGSDEPDPPAIVEDDVDTLIVSACWAVPLRCIGLMGPARDDETRFRTALVGRMRKVFQMYPGINDVIVCDALPSNSKVKAPFNAHFARQSTDAPAY
jgi:hypothetical protein